MSRYRRLYIGFALSGVLFSAGCQDEMPFETVPIEGRVTYDDGSLIEAASMTLTFNPMNVPAQGKMTPPGGQANVNVADGTFSEVMTRRPNDGVLVGRHKVVVASFRARTDGRPVPSDDVPLKFHKASTTPIEIEVKPELGQYFEIKVPRQ